MVGTQNVQRLRLTVVLTAVLMLLAGVVTVGTASPAHAVCATQPLQGDWRNINANTSSVTRVVVGFACGDQVLCDQNGHCTGGESYYTLRPFGKCHPTDCDWGTKRAYPMADGWQRAVYSYSWATKYVWVKTYDYYGKTYLRVYTQTDFTAADGRTDYTTDE
ncbi:MAG: hypothetical protein ACLGIA_13010 [Actinomycetes bacterium]